MVEPFQYVTGYSFGSGGVFGSNRGYSNSIYQSSTPNPFITWEVANMYNAGFESMFLIIKLILMLTSFTKGGVTSWFKEMPRCQHLPGFLCLMKISE